MRPKGFTLGSPHLFLRRLVLLWHITISGRVRQRRKDDRESGLRFAAFWVWASQGAGGRTAVGREREKTVPSSQARLGWRLQQFPLRGALRHRIFFPLPSFYRCHGAIKINKTFQGRICKCSIALAICCCSFNREAQLSLVIFPPTPHPPRKCMNCCFLCHSEAISSVMFLLYCKWGSGRKLLVTQWRYAAFIYMGKQ